MTDSQSFMSDIVSFLEKGDVKVADASTYSSHYYKSNPTQDIIVAGYFPNKACLVTAKAITYLPHLNSGNIHLIIRAELGKNTTKHILHKMDRFHVVTKINNAKKYCARNISVSSDIQKAAHHLEEFRKYFLVYVDTQFSLNPDFSDWVPTLTDDWSSESKRVGTLEAGKIFVCKVLSKMPTGIFAPDLLLSQIQ